MAGEPRFGMGTIPDDRSVIVVSDLHLGSREDPETSRRFCRFLDYISSGPFPVSCPRWSKKDNGEQNPAGEKWMAPPGRIILLGDILELWDSRWIDRNNSFLDALLPFLRMRDMDCDVVYVVGNHDEDIAEFITSHDEDRKKRKEMEKNRQNKTDEGRIAPAAPDTGVSSGKSQSRCDLTDYSILRVPGPGGRMEPESMKIRWGKDRTLEICNRRYPTPHARGGNLGLDVGGVKYAFIHGQQFDKEQITYTISRAFRQRFDPVDFFQDLASISVTKKMTFLSHVMNMVLAVALLQLFFTPAFFPLVLFIGAIGGIILAVIFLYGIFLFGFRERDQPSSSWLTWACALAFIVIIIILAAGRFYPQSVFPLLFLIPFISSLYILAVISLPMFIAHVKRTAYTLWSSRNMGSKEIVAKKRFDLKKYQYESRVLVFGHTHQADFEAVEGSKSVRLLVNTGTWVDESTQGKCSDHDTFMYIDKTGPCCMRWADEQGIVECYCRKDNYGNRKIPLCEYLVKMNIRLRD